MSQTVSDFSVGRLHWWDVCRICGNAGDGILGRLNRAGAKMELIQPSDGKKD